MVSRIDIAITPWELDALPAATSYVVIDALRATTSIAVLFHRGLESLRVVASLDEGRAAARQTGALLFGEEGGLRPAGFHYGNSPAEAATLDVSGKSAVLVTTNGTLAVCSVARRRPTFAGSLVNLSAVTGHLRSVQSVTLVCAGNAAGRLFSLEDFAVAAAFVQSLRVDSPTAQLGDAAGLAMGMRDPAELIPRSSHADVTRKLGFEADIAFASRLDAAPSVPAVVEAGAGWAVLRNLG
jgi:2-phosphosulfolactate phosphatase